MATLLFELHINYPDESQLDRKKMNLCYSLIHKPKKNFRAENFSPKKILVVQIAGIGDLVLATPAIKALKEKFPGGQLDVVTSPRAVDLLKPISFVDEVFPFDISKLRNPIKLLNPGNIRLVQEQLLPMREKNYDLIISLNNVSSMRGGLTLGALLKYIGGAVWMGRNTNNRAPYFDYSLDENEHDPISEVETKLQVIKPLVALVENQKLDLEIGKQEIYEAGKLLGGRDKCIALMPGANDSVRTWPIERFIEVGKWLTDKGYTLVVLGGVDEKEKSEKIECEIPQGKVIRVDGKLSLRQTTALLCHMKLALTNNTGPMHLAAATDIPIVALFCSYHAPRYYPWMDKEKCRLLTKDVPNKDVREGMRDSILGVSVEDVKKAINELLE